MSRSITDQLGKSLPATLQDRHQNPVRSQAYPEADLSGRTGTVLGKISQRIAIATGCMLFYTASLI